jgi:hypothetical protein
VYGGIFNSMEYLVSLGKVHPDRVSLEMHQPTQFQVVEFLKGIFVPFVSIYEILSFTYPENPKTNIVTVVCYTLFYCGWISLLAASSAYPGLRGWATVSFFVAGGTLASLRSGFRSRYNIRSNPVADVLTGMLLWPQVITQMRLQTLHAVESTHASGADAIIAVVPGDAN